MLACPAFGEPRGHRVNQTTRYLQSVSDQRGIEIGALVNYLLIDAIKVGASDIHIEPWESTLVVRIRLNGVLNELVHLPLDLMEKISGRLKVMANLISYQTDLPQEGHAPANLELGGVELRISTLATGVLIWAVSASRRKRCKRSSSCSRARAD